MRLSGKMKEQIVSALEIPRDLAFQETIMTVTGTNQILIENYRSIAKLSDVEIGILCIKGRIWLRGNRMKILRYTSDEMLITGCINEIILKR